MLTVRMEHRYREDVLDQLAAHGVKPTPVTSPDLVHDFLNDLYRYELRRLRDQLLRREIMKMNYRDRVIEVRRRYSLLSLKAWQWVKA